MKRNTEIKSSYYLYNWDEKPLLLNDDEKLVSNYTNEQVVSRFCDKALEKESGMMTVKYDGESDCTVYSFSSKTEGEYKIYIDSNFKYSEKGKLLWESLNIAKRYSQGMHNKDTLKKIQFGLSIVGLATVLGAGGFALKKGTEVFIESDNKRMESEWEEIQESLEYQNYQKNQDGKQQMEEREEYKINSNDISLDNSVVKIKIKKDKI